MRDRPINLAETAILDILAGRKTQDRLPVRPAKGYELDEIHTVIAQGAGRWGFFCDPGPGFTLRHPHGVPGDRLWVREPWRTSTVHDHIGISRSVEYKADGANIVGHHDEIMELPGKVGDIYGWRPSTHMPRWASRVDLELLSVRVERLQDITEEDAQAEGAQRGGDALHHATARNDFSTRWDDTASDTTTWACNPWVWVREFRRVQP